jgi:phosphoribosylamine--glycine ligase
VEVAVGAFFNGSDFIYPINVNFEHKRMFPGDIGPNTGEMGTSMFWAGRNKIFEETLLKMKDRLAAAKYVGYIDINCIANVRGIYPLEFTARFGYPTINIQMEGVLSEWGEFFHGLARGEKPELKTKRGFQVGVVVAVPPFPFTDPQAFRKYSEDATVILKKTTDGVHIADIKMVEGKWRLAGQSGYALIVTGSGSTMADARKQAYNRVSNIMIPNMFYRTDIGEKWTEDSDRLQTWGYLY